MPGSRCAHLGDSAMVRPRMLLFALVSVGLFTVTAAAQPAVQAPPAGVKFLPGIAYRQTDKGLLHLDIAMPAQGDEALPVVLIVHGTGDLSKGPKANVPLLFQLAQKGYVGISIAFRHTAADPYPAAIEDVRAAVRWLRANAGPHRIHPERIAALGYSGGGTLALLLGMSDGPADQPSSKVQAVVAYYPPTDLAQLHA